MLTFFFSKREVNDWSAAARCDTAAFASFFWHMAEQGIYLPCSQYEALFVSAAHHQQDIEATIAAAQTAFSQRT
jgi:glutamate-1-semialdehyde 2,1-aminomutase